MTIVMNNSGNTVPVRNLTNQGLNIQFQLIPGTNRSVFISPNQETLVDLDIMLAAKSTFMKFRRDGLIDFNPGVLSVEPDDPFTINASPYGDDDLGDGTFSAPYKTIAKSLESVGDSGNYTIKLAPGAYIEPALTWKGNANLIGSVANNTSVQANINYASSPGETTVFQFANVAHNGLFTLDLSNSVFASVTMENGAIGINRVDSNPAAIVLFRGGIFASTINGGNVVLSGVILEPITVNPGAFLITNQCLMLNTITLNGTASLRTVSCIYSAIGAYVNGVPVGPDTPTWSTDGASDFGFTGSVTKTTL